MHVTNPLTICIECRGGGDPGVVVHLHNPNQLFQEERPEGYSDLVSFPLPGTGDVKYFTN